MARPKAVVDVNVLKRLAEIHCTMEETAFVLGVSKDTLERRFMDVIHIARAEGKASLRRYQWELAKKGNPAMQIWLGKQLLGQRDFKLDLSDLTDEMLAAEVRRRMADGKQSP